MMLVFVTSLLIDSFVARLVHRVNKRRLADRDKSKDDSIAVRGSDGYGMNDDVTVRLAGYGPVLDTVAIRD